MRARRKHAPPTRNTARRGAKLPATCRAELAAFLVAQQPPFSPFIATTLMLMAELAGGTDCPHAPYFATLPGPTDCLLNWSEEEQALLAGAAERQQGGMCARADAHAHS